MSDYTDFNDFVYGIDYDFGSGENQTGTADIILKSGPYSGVVFRYGKIHVEEIEGDNAVLRFDYDVASFPEGFKNDTTFQKYIGDFLVYIIASNTEVENKENDEEN